MLLNDVGILYSDGATDSYPLSDSVSINAMDNSVDRMIRLMTLGTVVVSILVYTVFEIL